MEEEKEPKSKVKVEATFEHNGLPCVVLAVPMGHRCGYVGVRENNPLFGVKYSDESECLKKKLEEMLKQPIPENPSFGLMVSMLSGTVESRPDVVLDVHGGITYSADGKGDYPIKSEDIWWFGFDCAHAGDGRDFEIMDEAHKKIYEGFPSFHEDVVRSFGYVVSECKKLADQLSLLERA